MRMAGLTTVGFILAIPTAGRSGGGSTITQQLAKNAYLSQDQTIERKAKEFFLALKSIEIQQAEILTMYLNNSILKWGLGCGGCL